MAKIRYGKIEDHPVYLMDKASKCFIKKGEMPKGYACVQSLVTGQTAIVKETKIKKITTKFPLPLHPSQIKKRSK